MEIFQERSSNAVPNVRRGELAFVQSLLVCLYKLLGVPQCPRIFKVYTALLRRVARAAATAAATAAIVDKLEQMLSEQSVQQTLNSYCNYSSSWGGVLPLSCGAQSLQQMVQEVAALDGAVLLLLLETTVLRLLRAAQRNDADTALYAHLLKHLLKVNGSGAAVHLWMFGFVRLSVPVFPRIAVCVLAIALLRALAPPVLAFFPGSFFAPVWHCLPNPTKSAACSRFVFRILYLLQERSFLFVEAFAAAAGAGNGEDKH